MSELVKQPSKTSFATLTRELAISPFFHNLASLETLDVLLFLAEVEYRTYSKFVDFHLKPSVQTSPSYIKDIIHFLYQLLKLGPLPNDSTFATLDAFTLYPRKHR